MKLLDQKAYDLIQSSTLSKAKLTKTLTKMGYTSQWNTPVRPNTVYLFLKKFKPQKTLSKKDPTITVKGLLNFDDKTLPICPSSQCNLMKSVMTDPFLNDSQKVKLVSTILEI